MGESQRQQALVEAITSGGGMAVPGLRESGARAARGLEAYRANAGSIAERALAAAFPTVEKMLGPENLAHLAREFWREGLPVRGDLGEFGEALPGFIEAHDGLGQWPWLADCARLDWAMHLNERAEDAIFEGASLSLLGSEDPARLRLRLMPGAALVESRFPVGMILAAHRAEGDAIEAAFGRVRFALEEGLGERVLVARHGWRATVYPLESAEAAWTRDLLEATPLDTALERAGPGFDFAGWLARALRESWLRDVVSIP